MQTFMRSLHEIVNAPRAYASLPLSLVHLGYAIYCTMDVASDASTYVPHLLDDFQLVLQMLMLRAWTIKQGQGVLLANCML